MTQVTPFTSGVVNYAIPDHSPIVLPPTRPTPRRNAAHYRAILSARHILSFNPRVFPLWLALLQSPTLSPTVLINATLDMCGSPYHLGACTLAVRQAVDYEEYDRLESFLGAFVPLPKFQATPAPSRFTTSLDALSLAIPSDLDTRLDSYIPHYHSDRSISLEIPADPNDMVLPAILQEWWEFPNPCAILLSPPYLKPNAYEDGDRLYMVRVLVSGRWS